MQNQAANKQTLGYFRPSQCLCLCLLALALAVSQAQAQGGSSARIDVAQVLGGASPNVGLNVDVRGARDSDEYKGNLATLMEFGFNPVNAVVQRVLPNTMKGVTSDLNAAEENVVHALGSMPNPYEQLKNVYGLSADRYKELDKLFDGLLARVLKQLQDPEQLCRQLMEQTKPIDKQLSSTFAETTQGANSLLNKMNYGNWGKK